MNTFTFFLGACPWVSSVWFFVALWASFLGWATRGPTSRPAGVAEAPELWSWVGLDGRTCHARAAASKYTVHGESVDKYGECAYGECFTRTTQQRQLKKVVYIQGQISRVVSHSQRIISQRKHHLLIDGRVIFTTGRVVLILWGTVNQWGGTATVRGNRA